MKNHKIFRALSIAGFDGSGGAGIQADLKTFSAIGCYGTTVLTALPVQNTMGVKKVYEIPEQCVAEQLETVLEDIGTDSIKIGMLHRPEVIDAVAGVLDKFPSYPLVLDPVMVSSSGKALLTESARKRMKEKLFPRTLLLTPNLPEASVLLEREITTRSQMEKAALDILKQGVQAIIVKGGHLEDGLAEDLLCTSNNEMVWLSSQRVKTKNTHGTGCTFSAAIAAFLAQGLSLHESVKKGKDYITKCIEGSAYCTLGKGNGPLLTPRLLTL